MLEDSPLCSMLHPTDYAKNYAGIMGAGLGGRKIDKFNFLCKYSLQYGGKLWHWENLANAYGSAKY